jgi:hypothetical protein
MAAFFSDMTGVGFMTRITATRSLGSGAATGSTRSHFDLRQFGAALLLTAATVGEDIFQHGQHVVFRSVLRGFMAIKRKQLIKLGRRVAKPFAVDDLNHPARLEKSTGLGDGSRGAYPNRFDRPTILSKRGS